MGEYSCLEYLSNAAKHLRVERETIAVNCVLSRQNEYLQTVESELLDCHPLLRNDDKLYPGFDRGIQLMANIYRNHVTEMVAEATKENNDQKDAIATEKEQLVRNVYQLHQEYSQFVEEYFMNHFLFRNALTEAFQTLCNTWFWKLLVAVCDNILRNRSMTATDVEDALQMVAELFPYVYTEDTVDQIADSYRKKLRDRLFWRKCSNFDNEKIILDKLKLKCMYGRKFIFRMEGLLDD